MAILREKLVGLSVVQHLALWTTNFLTNKPQYERLKDCASDVVVCNMGAPQGTALFPFLYTLYIPDFRHNIASGHLQKSSGDKTVTDNVSEGNDREYMTGTGDFVDWCK